MSKTHLDSNSVIRNSYSVEHEALRTIPAAETSFAIELDADDGDSVLSQPRSQSSESFFSSIDAFVPSQSDSVDISNYRCFAVQIDPVGFSAQAKVEIHASVNGESFVKVAESLIQNSSVLMQQTDACYKMFKLVFDPQTNNAGSFSAEYILKG